MKEKLEIKRFHNKSIAHSLDELWNQLFEDSYVTRENVITPSMDSNVYEVVECENLDGVYNVKLNENWRKKRRRQTYQ